MSEQKIDGYRLRRANGRPLRLKSTHWLCDGIYISDICLAAHLRPLTGGSEGAPKEDLRALLRGLGHLALTENLWRPVVGVVEDRSGALGQLGADQEWHRGDFLVFVTDRPREKLEDLLRPGELLPELVEEKESESRNPAWFRRKLDDRLTREETADELRALVDRLLPPPSSGETQGSAEESAIRDGFDDWVNRVRSRAEDVAQGRAPK